MIFNFKFSKDAKTLGGKTAEEFATSDHGHTADEVGALSKNGGTVDGTLAVKGILAVGDPNLSEGVQDILRNANRTLKNELGANGDYALWDSTNSGYVIKSTRYGTNTFYGISNGNLSLTGGALTNTGGTILALIGTDVDNVYTQYKGKSGALGFLGFVGADNPVMVGSDGATVRKLHHDGNSAKVVISETAPADTSALWVY